MEYVLYLLAAILFVLATYLWLKTLFNNRKQQRNLKRELEEIRQLQNRKHPTL